MIAIASTRGQPFSVPLAEPREHSRPAVEQEAPGTGHEQARWAPPGFGQAGDEPMT